MREDLCCLTCKIQLWVSDETMFEHQKNQSIIKHENKAKTTGSSSPP